MIWSVTLKPEKARDADEFGGGLAYYGGRLFVTTGFADGVLRSIPTTARRSGTRSVSAPVRGAPLVFGDRVFVDLDRQQAARHGRGRRLGPVVVLRPAGSRGLCRRQQPGRLAATSSWRRSRSGELVGLRLDNGRTVWNESLVGPRREVRAFGNLADIRGRPVIDRGLVLAMGSAGTARRRSTCARGQRLWERNVGGNQTPWVGRPLRLRRHQQRRRRRPRARHRQGEVGDAAHPVSRTRSAASRSCGRGPVLAGDRLLIGGSTGELLALSPYTGEIIGKLDLREPMRLAPVIANRTIYVLTDSGRLIALR